MGLTVRLNKSKEEIGWVSSQSNLKNFHGILNTLGVIIVPTRRTDPTADNEGSPVFDIERIVG